MLIYLFEAELTRNMMGSMDDELGNADVSLGERWRGRDLKTRGS
jgi:hypothetical protein